MRAVLVFVVAGCSSHTVAGPKPGSCEATAQAAGKPVTTWQAPAGCTVKAGSRQPHLLATEADARAQLDCQDPAAALGVDFAKRQLVVTTRSFSPAQVGLDVYDDGKQITLVSRQRIPCPNDPRPMPGPDTTLVFDAAAGVRTFAEGSCNVESSCK